MTENTIKNFKDLKHWIRTFGAYSIFSRPVTLPNEPVGELVKALFSKAADEWTFGDLISALQSDYKGREFFVTALEREIDPKTMISHNSYRVMSQKHIDARTNKFQNQCRILKNNIQLASSYTDFDEIHERICSLSYKVQNNSELQYLRQIAFEDKKLIDGLSVIQKEKLNCILRNR